MRLDDIVSWGFEIDRTLSVYYGMFSNEQLHCTKCKRQSLLGYWVRENPDDLRCVDCTNDPQTFREIKLILVRGERLYIVQQ